VNDAGKLALQIPQQGTIELSWPDEQGRWALAPAPHVSIEFNEEDGAVESFTLRQPPAVITMKRRVAAEGLPSLEEVLAKIDAAAPLEAIEGIAPLRATARVEMPNQGLSGTWIMQYQDAEHWRTDMDFGKFGRIINVLDDENSWSYVGLVGYREMSVAERAEAAQGSPFATVHAAETYEEMSVQGVQGEGDDSVVLLKLVPKYGEPSILHIEMKTGNTRRIETGSSLGEIGAIPVNIKMSDHRRQHGFSFAFEIEVSNSFTGATRILLEEIETGVTLPEDVFERDDG